MSADSILMAAAGGSKVLTFVGSYAAALTASASDISVPLTSLTGGVGSSPAEGDVVVVFFAINATSDLTYNIFAYDKIADLYANDTQDINLFVGYRVMGSTPDTTLTLTGGTTSASNGGSIVVQVWRNANPYIPPANATTATALNSYLANPPSITPGASGYAILCAGAGTLAGATASGQTYSSSDLTGFVSANGQGSSVDSIIGSGYKLGQPGGSPFDPAAFTGSASDSTNYSWAAISLVITPDAGNDPAPSLIATSQAAHPKDGSSSLTINKPAGTQQGDVMVAFLCADSGSVSTWTSPAGWTEVADQGARPCLCVSYKVAGASEGASYAFSHSNDTNDQAVAGAIATYRYGGYAAIGSSVSGANPLTPTGPSTSFSYTRLIGFAANSAGSSTITSTMNNRIALNNDAAAPSYGLFDETIPSGSPGTRSFTVGTTTNVAAVLLTLTPS